MNVIRSQLASLATAVVCCLCAVGGVHAQAGLRSKICRLQPGDSLQLDSLAIAPHSEVVTVGGKPVVAGYMLDYGRAVLHWQAGADSVNVVYRVLPPLFTRTYSHKNPKLIEPDFGTFANPFAYQPTAANTGLIDKQGLNMTGSVSRGLGFGNTQDLVINSNLNLQISGRLNNDVEVLAAVSDDNNPIQPEGNTQQLQDFDRVFIQFTKNKTRLTLGDFQMLRPDDYFLNYNKKSRGMSLMQGGKAGKNWTYEATADLALSRGRFSRNTLAGQEGNQGPYRLRGANGEIFIVLIAGTEAVYLDGERMQRGEQNDYTINYNTGEVTFMPKRLITSFSRIVVEFQYSDRNYARSVYTLGNHWQHSHNLRLRMDYFSEQDNKNQPFQRQLSDTDRYILGQAGNDPSLAVTSSQTRVESFDRSRILYRKTDTLVGVQVFTVYRYTADPASDTVFYALAFIFLGEGKGNYRIAANSANGRVYEWVAPSGGEMQGSYEPIVQLIAPNRMQMVTAGVDWQPDSFTRLSVDYAHSRLDRNTFSPIGNNANGGNGLRMKMERKKHLDRRRQWLLSSNAQYEVVDKNFRYVERYRPVEFDRQWNRRLQNEARKDTGYNEHIANAGLNLSNPGKMLLTYDLAYYNRNRQLSGFNQRVEGFYRVGKWLLDAGGELNGLNPPETGSSQPATAFYRYRIRPSLLLKQVKLYAIAEAENSRFAPPGKDSLLDGSYAYRSTGAGLASSDSGKTYYSLDYYYRQDGLPESRFAATRMAHNVSGNLNRQGKNGNSMKLNATYRHFEDHTTPAATPDRHLLLRLEHNLNLWKRTLSWNNFYQLGTGQELKRQYSYLEVQPGMGLYQWNDYNGDSLQQLNEFEQAVFKDKARFIRVFLPTTDYVSTANLQLNSTLQWNPANAWAASKGLKGVLSRFNHLAVLRIDRKTFAGLSPLEIANPLLSRLPDTAFVSLNSLLRNNLFYNRNNPRWGMDLNWQTQSNKQLLTNGVDARTRTERELNVRYTFSKSYLLRVAAGNGRRTYFNQFFTQNNFDYTYWQCRPQLEYQQGVRLRISAFYSGFAASNHSGSETTLNHELGSEMRLSLKENGLLTTRYSYNRIQFSGLPGTPLAFDMLAGLQDGNNQTWALQMQHRLSNNIQLTLAYDGRKTEGNPAVHIARAEARYLF